MDLISNIINNYSYLHQDYTGIHLDKIIIYNLIINVLISLFLILIFYLIGTKIKSIILKKENYLAQNIFIKIAFGYIFIGSGLAIIGFFSLLYPLIIIEYLLLCILIAFLPINSFKKNLIELRRFIKELYGDFKIHKWIFIWITLFIFIGFIKLISPEIREDQYHTDLPVIYLKDHGIMRPSKEGIMVSASPQLGEMNYLIAIFLGSKEATRYIHFIFYCLVLLLLYSLSKDKKYKFAIIAPLIFATAPEVIRETSSQYTDFQWIFLFLLAVFILIKNRLTTADIFLAGIIIGAMISTKLWTIAFLIALIFYLIIKNYKSGIVWIKSILFFTAASIIIPFVWFLRSYILTGNPVYPAFSNKILLENSINFGILNYFKLNSALLSTQNFKVFSPIFFLGIAFLFYKLRDNIKNLGKLNISIFFIFLTIAYLFINYPYGRYLMGLYSVATIIASMGLYKFIYKHTIPKYLISVVLFLLFFYYFLNSTLVLPYGIGIADKNKYLTRTLSRDNSSYYDFNHSFNHFILKNDLVATYGIFGYYYADFNYIDINYIFDRKTLSFDNFKNKGVTKFFIKGGDINWFCNKLNLANCNQENYKLLSKFSAVPYSGTQYYLYSIK